MGPSADEKGRHLSSREPRRLDRRRDFRRRSHDAGAISSDLASSRPRTRSIVRGSGERVLRSIGVRIDLVRPATRIGRPGSSKGSGPRGRSATTAVRSTTWNPLLRPHQTARRTGDEAEPIDQERELLLRSLRRGLAPQMLIPQIPCLCRSLQKDTLGAAPRLIDDLIVGGLTTAFVESIARGPFEFVRGQPLNPLPPTHISARRRQVPESLHRIGLEVVSRCAPANTIPDP